MKTALVLGAGGFIGSNLVNRLKDYGYWVRGVDIKPPAFKKSFADEFYLGDLRNINTVFKHSKYHVKLSGIKKEFDYVFQLAADMGGAGYIFSGDNDANVMHNSAQINLNVCEAFKNSKSKIFYSSSACIYPAYNQLDPIKPNCKEDSSYPAAPDSEYGWEKLFSERLYMSYARNFGLDVRIARFHNIFGKWGTYDGGKEKAPAALCRKVAMAKDGDEIEVWGKGYQTRSFLHIDECLEGVERLMRSDCKQPLNIGSDELITINGLAQMIIDISGKELTIKNVPGNVGVMGRNSDNELIYSTLGWRPTKKLYEGIEQTYKWINEKVNDNVQ